MKLLNFLGLCIWVPGLYILDMAGWLVPRLAKTYGEATFVLFAPLLGLLCWVVTIGLIIWLT